MRHYVESSPEPIESRLGGERGMRVHLLAVIASRMGITRAGDRLDLLQDAPRRPDREGEGREARRRGAGLPVRGAARGREEDGAFQATGFGKRISTLYIDPVTGVLFRKNLGGFEPGTDHTARLLHLVARSPDFEPKFPMREKHYPAGDTSF